MTAPWSAVIDEPHSRFTVCAPTSLGIGVSSWAKRATLKACSSVCCTQPQITSSISAGSSSGLRRRSAFITSAESVSARTLRNIPPFERPIGVRTASTTTASLMASLRVEALAGGGQGGELPRRGVERAERAVLLRGLQQRRRPTWRRPSGRCRRGTAGSRDRRAAPCPPRPASRRSPPRARARTRAASAASCAPRSPRRTRSALPLASAATRALASGSLCLLGGPFFSGFQA